MASQEKSRGTPERKRPSAAEQLTRMEKRLRKIEDGQEQLRLLLEELLEKKRGPELSAKQKEIFAAIAKVSGRDAESRREVEQLLSALEGERSTQAFVTALRLLLKEKEWGVLCKCGQPAGVTWQKNDAFRAGGSLQFYHTGGKHGSHSRVPRLQIVERPDLREAKYRALRKAPS